MVASSPPPDDSGAKRRILDAALAIFHEQGAKALTQPRTAAAAGVRQSHLTYYFPKKADLLAAVLRETHVRAAARESETEAGGPEAALNALEALILDADRMRSFLHLVIEASLDPTVGTIVAGHTNGLASELAPLFGRDAHDPLLHAFVDRARGLGIRLLLDPTATTPGKGELQRIADEMGLRPLLHSV